MQEPVPAPGTHLLDDATNLWIAGFGVAAMVLLLLVLAWVIWRRLMRRSEIVAPPPIQPGVDVSQIPPQGPASDQPVKIEIYGISVRLAVIVLAPVGRDGTAPQPDEFADLMDQLVPGVGQASRHDLPLVRIWEGQLSSQGFANAFANRVPLPGDRGKGTPWCSLVGKFTGHGRQYLVGLVGCASTNNALSQYVIQHEGQWNDILRVRYAEAK